MNEQLYKKLGIDSSQDLKAIMSELEDKQFEYLQRAETASDENRKQEIANVLEQIDNEIASLKEQMKTLSSSVVVDDATDKAPVKKEDKEKKNAEIANKVDSLKQKEAEKKAKEAERKQKEAEKAAKEQQAKQAQQQSQPNSGAASQPNNAQSIAPAPIKQVSNTNSDITNAISYYNNQEYDKAFPILKKLSEGGDASAQYLIATMYLYGYGVAPDNSRALFWLKKSAESGELAGQAAYGTALVSAPINDAKSIKEGFKYLQLAADKGDAGSMLDYVNACLSDKGDKKNLTKAMEYCDKLKLVTDDSFDKKKLEETKTKLKEKKKTSGNNSNNTSSTSSSYNSYKPKKRIPWKQIIIFLIIAAIGFSIWKHYKESGDSTEESRYESTDTKAGNNSNGKVKITVSSGNVRSGAGKSNNSIGLVHDGEVYEMTGSKETVDGTVWYEIYFDNNNQTGWVSSKILDVE